MVNKEKLRLEFSERLHAACNEAGIRSHGRATDIALEISSRVGKITPGAAGKWLKAEAIPHAMHMRALADWLGVRVEWLQYNTKPMRGPASIVEGLAPGKLTIRLTARLADLERRGRLTKEITKALHAMLDAAST